MVQRLCFPATVAAGLFLLAAPAAAVPPELSEIRFLPGDTGIVAAVEVQEWVQIAAGGPGYLAVWQDNRTNLSGLTNQPDELLAGNANDIYAVRLDASGNVLDPSPIVISNDGRNQTKPQVAWNGSNWLVVWTSERPDWYFFEDIVGARVSPAGVVLDDTPIPIRLESSNPSNDYGVAPHVASDGTNWLVVFQDQVYLPNPPLPDQRFPTVEGRRIGPDGSLLDADTVLLHQHDVPAFGPRTPRVAWAGGQYLVVWEYPGILAKRFDAALQPIDAQPFEVAGLGSFPRVATDGTDFFVSTGELLGYRVTADGQVLDPFPGIDFSVPGRDGALPGPDVAWDGFVWTIALAAGVSSFEPDIFQARVDTDGTVLGGGPQQVLTSSEIEFHPAIASTGDGRSQLAWVQWEQPLAHREDIRTLQVDGSAPPGPDRDLSAGLHRQSRLRFASNGSGYLAAFTSEGGSLTRVLVQRLDAAGDPIDPEPLELTTYPEVVKVSPDVAFNGSVYLVVWVLEGSVMAQRVSADLALLDPAPVTLITDLARQVAVGALGSTFLVAYTTEISGDFRLLEAFRVAQDLTVLDSPFGLGPNYVLDPVVESLGGQWLVAWERQPTHNQLSSDVYTILVSADGTPGSAVQVNEVSTHGDDPDIAVGGDRALIVWSDNISPPNPRIDGRLLDASGAFMGPELLIADPPGDQYFPEASWNGSGFVASWVDYRGLGDVEQLRGDIYAARIDVDGVVLDPDGFQITSGLLPEDLPDLAAANGMTVVGFSQLHGESSPEVQRIGYRIITELAAAIFSDGFESGNTSAWSTSAP